jgi:hypothetical protein
MAYVLFQEVMAEWGLFANAISARLKPQSDELLEQLRYILGMSTLLSNTPHVLSLDQLHSVLRSFEAIFGVFFAFSLHIFGVLLTFSGNLLILHHM